MATDFVAYGIYPDRTSFDKALEGLRAAGFRSARYASFRYDDRSRLASRSAGGAL